MQDEVEKPDHYQFGQMEAWDIIELALIGTHDPVTAYHKGVALAYLLRASRKGGDTDIAKASAHLKRETARHVVRIPPAPDYDPASVAFRHCDPNRVCGIPNSGRSVPNLVHRSAHPMAAEALRDQDATPPGCAPPRMGTERRHG